MDKSTVVTREQLYEEVWTTSLQVLAKKYGISDVGLGKICRRLNVPKPGLGYWAKIEAGQNPGKTPLPGRSLQQHYEIRPRPQIPEETEEQRRARLAHEQLVAQFADVQVPEMLSQPHRLTRRTEQHYKTIAKRVRETARVRRLGAPVMESAPYNDKGRYRCKAEDGFPLLVSLANVDRALRILDTWAKELERLGFVLDLDREKTKLEARKDGEAFAFHLREGYTKREFTVEERKARKDAGQYPQDWDWEGSNKFMFGLEGSEYGTRREWTDGSHSLETRMPEMLATIVEFVPLAKKAREERLEQERIRAEKERRRWEEESRRQEEKRQLDNLVAAEKEVSNSEAALRYLDRLEAELRRSDDQLPAPIAEWLQRARDIAKRTNPLARWIRELRAMGP